MASLCSLLLITSILTSSIAPQPIHSVQAESTDDVTMTQSEQPFPDIAIAEPLPHRTSTSHPVADTVNQTHQQDGLPSDVIFQTSSISSNTLLSDYQKDKDIGTFASTFAQSQNVAALPCESNRANIMLVIDDMMASPDVENAKNAAIEFVSRLVLATPENPGGFTDRVGITLAGNPATASAYLPLSNDRDLILNAIASITPRTGNKNLGPAIGEADSDLGEAVDPDRDRIIVILSDGAGPFAPGGEESTRIAISTGLGSNRIITVNIDPNNSSLLPSIAQEFIDNEYYPIIQAERLFYALEIIFETLRCPYDGYEPDPIFDTSDCPLADALTNVGDPINITDGSWYYIIPCLRLDGRGLPISVGLRYSTRALYQGINASISPGWTTSYSRRFRYFPDAGRAILTLETGKTHTFLQRSDGSFTTPPSVFMQPVYVPETDIQPALLLLNYRDGGYEIYTAQDGFLREIVDRFNNRTIVQYLIEDYDNDTVEELIIRVGKVPNGVDITQQIDLRYEPQPDNSTQPWQLRQIADHPDNGGPQRIVNLTYNAAGLLSRVVDAENYVHTFAYDDQQRITTLCDANNDPAVLGEAAQCTQNTYFDGNTPYKIASQTLPNNTTLNFTWTAGSQDNTLAVTYNQGLEDQRIVRYLHTEDGVNRGQIARIYNPNSTTAFTSLSYTIDGLVTQVVDPLGRRTDYSYNAAGDLLEMRAYTDTAYTAFDATQMTYNSFGQMTTLREPAGAETRWQYNDQTGALEARGHWVVINDATNPYTTTFQTNAFGQITQATFPDGTISTQQYDATYGYPRVTTYDVGEGRLNLTESTVYDWRGYLVQSTNLQGITTSYVPNNLGWVTESVFDPDGRAIRTAYTYDNVGNIRQIVDDAGPERLNATSVYSYTFVGTAGEYDISATQDPLGQVVNYGYTAYGELEQISEIQPNETQAVRTTTMEYTPEGWLSTVTLHDGRVVEQIAYNDAGEPTTITDARGVQTGLTYDAKGRLQNVQLGTAAVDAFPAVNGRLTYTYDANDRLISLNEQVTAETSRLVVERRYDGLNQLVWERDGIGNQTTYGYDNRRNWLTTIIQGDNVDTEELRTSLTYDPLGRLTQQIVDPGPNGPDADHQHLVTQYFYTAATPDNDRWNLRRMVNPRNFTTQFRYDSLGLLDQVIDSRNAATSYVHDNLGYLTQIAHPSGAPSSYSPDLIGQIRSLTRNNQTETWTYNADGTMRSSTDFATRPTTYQYDTTGRLTAIDRVGTDADATFTYLPNDLLSTATSSPDGTTNETTTYTYDALNRLASRARAPHTISYSYNAASELTNIGYWERGTVAYSYDERGLVQAMNPWGTGNTTYTYRSTNLLETITRPTPNVITSNYTYDTASRLTGINHTKDVASVHNIAYTLDQNDNRTAMQDQWGTTTYQYDELDRLTQAQYPAIANGPAAETINYGYDPAGNRTTVGDASFVFDASDQFDTAVHTALTYDANGNLTTDFAGTTYTYDAADRLRTSTMGDVTTTYQYDALGNLVRQIETQAQTATTTDFLLDELGSLPHILGEIRSDGTERLYAHGPEGLHAQQIVGGTTSYPLLDGQNSIRNLTDIDGTATHNKSYDAWGIIRHMTGATASGVLDFTGEQRNPDGSIHLRARTYQPTLGRFLQRDSIDPGLLGRGPQGHNRYSYVENNPVMYTDPSGHMTDSEQRAFRDALQSVGIPTLDPPCVSLPYRYNPYNDPNVPQFHAVPVSEYPPFVEVNTRYGTQWYPNTYEGGYSAFSDHAGFDYGQVPGLAVDPLQPSPEYREGNLHATLAYLGEALGNLVPNTAGPDGIQYYPPGGRFNQGTPRIVHTPSNRHFNQPPTHISRPQFNQPSGNRQQRRGNRATGRGSQHHPKYHPSPYQQRMDRQYQQQQTRPSGGYPGYGSRTRERNFRSR